MRGVKGHEGVYEGSYHLGGCLTLAPLPHQRLAPAIRPAGSSSSEDSRIAWLCAADHRVFRGRVGLHGEVTQDRSG